jgi:organic radical activating enzyme
MESLSYAQGWLAGMYDAEGHLDSAPRLSQSFVVNPEKCQQIEQYLTICDIKYNKQACGKMNIYIISDGAAFLSICPPATHRKRLRDWSLRSAKDEVVNSVKLAGSGETFDLTTGTHNFICEGFPVHNCDTDFESKSRIISLPDILNLVEDFAFKGKIFKSDLVVITGGEPFRQNIFPLCDWLLSRNFRVQIETAGNLWVNELELFFEDGTPITIVCSPKTGKVHEKVQKYCHDWKYLIQEGQTSEMDGLPTMSTQVPGLKQNLWRPSQVEGTIWVQPCEAYKISKVSDFNSEQLVLVASPDEESTRRFFADQLITRTVRDEEQTKRNMKLAAEIAMKYNYRLSLQLHKQLGLP